MYTQLTHNSFLNTSSDIIVASRKVVVAEEQILLASPHLPQSLPIPPENSKRRTEWLVGRFLLAELLFRYCQIDRLPAIELSATRKPFFNHPAYPYFNISHSGDRVAVAISNKGAIGLDIEQHRTLPNYQKIAKTFFSITEQNWLKRHSNPQAAFWQLWTLREAAVKLYGKGVWQMKHIQCFPDKMQISADFANTFYCHYQLQMDWHLSLCTDFNLTKVMIITL